MYQRLRDLREDRDLPQRTLAELLHVSQATYSRYESGGLDIPSGALIALLVSGAIALIYMAFSYLTKG